MRVMKEERAGGGIMREEVRTKGNDEVEDEGGWVMRAGEGGYVL